MVGQMSTDVMNGIVFMKKRFRKILQVLEIEKIRLLLLEL